LQSIQKLLSQGAINQTGNFFDMAVQGSGFLTVRTPSGEQLYTRAGQMSVDKEGYLVNLQGMRLQGFAKPSGTGSLSDLNVTAAVSSPSPTTAANFKGNLSANPDEPIIGPFDATDSASIAATSNFNSSVQVFDSLGNPHNIEVHFTKTSEGQWQWNATSDGSNIVGGAAGTQQFIGGGTLTFDDQGRLTDVTGDSVPFTPTGTTTPQTMTLNFGDPINGSPPGTGSGGIVQQSTIASSMTFVGQDGYAAGSLAGVKINADGNIVGTFTNGQATSLGQIAIANFAAADQLERIGGNMFRSSVQAGTPNLGEPGTGGRGSIVAGALEQSNVDLADEFVHMIVAQRAFQANSKGIQTADQLLQELNNLKR